MRWIIYGKKISGFREFHLRRFKRGSEKNHRNIVKCQIFPAGMELFTASNEEQFIYIKK